MNNLTKATLRFVGSNSFKNVFSGKRDFTRTLWHMSKTPDYSGNQKMGSVLKVQNPSMNCKCGCGMHTKCERELIEFLAEEILTERKSQQSNTVPTNLQGFAVKVVGSEVELTKENEKEKIVVNFNVNHSVNTEDEEDLDGMSDKPNMEEMKSKPQFEVDIVKGSTTLSFTCSFLQEPPQEGEYDDVFGIDEMTIYEGEWNEKVYSVGGNVLDGYLYDLLMNLLEEKGISTEFVQKLSDLATAYEHSSYIGLLESLSKFTTGNNFVEKISRKTVA